MSSREISRRWVDAGITLAKDPMAEVKCPVCLVGMLKTIDIQKDEGSVEFERLISCPSCGARNALRMRNKVD